MVFHKHGCTRTRGTSIMRCIMHGIGTTKDPNRFIFKKIVGALNMYRKFKLLFYNSTAVGSLYK